MATQNISVKNGSSASYTFSRDAQWSSFTVKSFSFELDEDIDDWDYSDITNVAVSAGDISGTMTIGPSRGDSGYTITVDFAATAGRYANCDPGTTFHIAFGRNDRPAVIESAYIDYEGVEKKNRWLIYNGNKIYKTDDIVEAPNVTIDTRGQYYMTSYDYIQKILGHPDWTITSEYVLVTLDDSHEFYRDDITYYQGTIYPLYIYS